MVDKDAQTPTGSANAMEHSLTGIPKIYKNQSVPLEVSGHLADIIIEVGGCPPDADQTRGTEVTEDQ